MDQPSSPLAPPNSSAISVPSTNSLGKRPRANDEASDDELESTPNPFVVNQNTATVIKRYGLKKKLRAEQQTELNIFVNV